MAAPRAKSRQYIGTKERSEAMGTFQAESCARRPGGAGHLHAARGGNMQNQPRVVRGQRPYCPASLPRDVSSIGGPGEKVRRDLVEETWRGIAEGFAGCAGLATGAEARLDVEAVAAVVVAAGTAAQVVDRLVVARCGACSGGGDDALLVGVGVAGCGGGGGAVR